MSAKAYVQEAEEKLRHMGVPQADSKVLTGTPAAEIVRLAEGSGYNLVAMATHGRSGLGRWVFGSTTDKVLHSTICPILLIRPRGPEQTAVSPRGTITTLVVPLDGSTLAEAVLPAVRNIAKKMSLQIAVLRVVPSIGMLYAEIEPYAYDATLGKDVERLAGQYLRNVTENLQRLGIQSAGYQRRGYAAEEIIAFSEETPGSLIVMSTHGRSGVGRWLLGSVADRVVRTSSQPVLLIRAKDLAGNESAALR